MVRRHVEHRRHPRPEAVDGIELEAGRLRHHDPVARELQRVLGERGADVAAHHHRAHLGAQQLAGESGGRRLAVGAGDGEAVRLHHPPGQLQLPDDGYAARPHRGQGGQVERHPRAHHHELRAAEGLLGMAARPEGHALALERARLRGEALQGPGVGGEHAGAEPPQQARGRDAALGEADHRDRPGREPVAVREAAGPVTAHEDPYLVGGVAPQCRECRHGMSP